MGASPTTAEMLDLVARLENEEAASPETLPIAVLQPIVHLEAEVPIGYEALARFDGGLDPATQFERAAAAGRAVELELACCRAALRRLTDLPAGTFVSTNVSLACLTHPELIMMLRRVDTSRVAVEVTQQTRVDDVAVLDHHLSPIRNTGARLAIDDVGAGDFSIDQVAKTTPAIVKAAPRLVSSCHEDSERAALLGQVAELGRRLGAITIGVGVEQPEEADVLRRLGFDAAQGYLFGKPDIDPI